MQPAKQRIAALDIGDKRIGVAVSDALHMTAQPVGVVERHSIVGDIEKILTLLGDYDVGLIVAGLPIQMDGIEGKQAERVRGFCKRLSEETTIDIAYQDERLTSVQSERVLIDSGASRRRRRQVIDKLAAVLILQAYLDTPAYRQA